MNSLYFRPKRREACGISLEQLQNGDKKEILQIHDDWLIKKWNTTVKKEDFIYILGDFCLANHEKTEKILQKLNGRKFLIRGNHDKSCNGLERYFTWVGDIKEAKFTHDQYPFIKEGETFCVEMCHYPLMTWNRRPHGTFSAMGHCHGALDSINKESKELRVDVGLDAELSGYEFISLEKLYGYARKIVTDAGFDTFQDYVDDLILKQGYRI
jgi:calcineurin-like phosphoesterase family protein